jgi:hypothetical protein
MESPPNAVSSSIEIEGDREQELHDMCGLKILTVIGQRKEVSLEMYG